MGKKSAVSKGYRKQQGKKPYLSRRDIVILCAILVAVIVGGVLLFTYDDGALKTANGSIVDAGENWLIVNGSGTSGGHRYFKVGEIGTLEGYDRENAPLTDANIPRYVFRPQGEAEGVESIVVTTSHTPAQKLAEYVAATMKSMGSENLSEVAEAKAGERGYSYFVSVVEPAGEDAETDAEAAEEAPAEEVADAEPAGEAETAEAGEGEQAEPAYAATISAYSDCPRDSCIVVEIKSTADSREALPDEEALKALAGQAFSIVTTEEE